MLRLKLIDVFNNVQNSTSCHQKYLQAMQNMFISVPFEEFLDEFKQIFDVLFRQALVPNVDNINRCFSFCAKFCMSLTAPRNKRCESENGDSETHPFIARLIKDVLKYHNLADERGRYYSCHFIAVFLKEVGDDANLDSHLCDYIQDAMLERITDLKQSVRLQAVSALERLQDPSYSSCPVIKAFIQGLGDPSASVRRAIVQNMAPCKMTLRHIIERIRDVDHTVRSAAFTKCAMIGPKFLKIADRQAVMLTCISEDNKSVKKVLSEILLPKWLAAYDHDYIKFMNALRLDADENDIKQTVFIYEKFLDVLFKSEPLKDLVLALTLDENKLLSQEEISVESVFYWSYLLRFFETKTQNDDYNLAPELTSLCKFIESLIQDRSSRDLNDWEYLEYQQILFRLLQIAERADLADDVGRQLLHKLIVKTMSKTKLEASALIQLVIILQKLLPDAEKLSNEICMVICEIMEPLDEQGPNEQVLRDNNFKEAEIRVKLNVLRHEQDEAVKKNDFLAAARIQEEMELFRLKDKELREQFEIAANKVTRAQEDPEMISRALDILIAFLQMLQAQKIPVSLRSCMNEVVVPLVVNTNPNLHWRVFKCVALFSLISRDVASENLKFISSPIIMYRLVSTYDKPTLLISVGAISDLLRVYGKSLFNTGDGGDPADTKRNGARRLYKISSSAEMESLDFNNITCEDLIDVILDMLDDEVQEIRENAAMAISRLVYTGLMVSSSLLLRLFLKWFNPVTEKYDQKIQQVLGASIIHFAEHVKGSAEILEKTVIPTLCSIGNAPHTSPLFDVDVDNVLRFLAYVTKIQRTEFSETHQNLAHSILSKIQYQRQEQCLPLLTSMLLCLDEPNNNEIVVDELAKQVESCLKVVNDKAALKTLNKYRKKLTGQACDLSNTTRYSSLLDSSLATAPKNDESASGLNETSRYSRDSAKKRKQLRTIREATPLATVTDEREEQIENDIERDEVFIETPTSDTSSSQESAVSFNPRASPNQIIPETPSDSGESAKSVRRSKRKIMKKK